MGIMSVARESASLESSKGTSPPYYRSSSTPIFRAACATVRTAARLMNHRAQRAQEMLRCNGQAVHDRQGGVGGVRLKLRFLALEALLYGFVTRNLKPIHLFFLPCIEWKRGRRRTASCPTPKSRPTRSATSASKPPCASVRYTLRDSPRALETTGSLRFALPRESAGGARHSGRQEFN